MLELRGITKIYKPEKSAPVTALDKVDLSFGDRGMVFVLGKSGSGKSTLLNVIGGLDGADGGEIVIDGKSSLSFGTGDYDAYRNTYIGFIFQEYNLLDEFTVAENISLALELQGKRADGEKIAEILKAVDLEGYGDRRPRQLSGGQRQRVAIARALIKDPKIIMADEPTGALDSQTGRAVLEALKKASRERLVIVVSHDREFAEEYGDRIIELSDGKVIGDRDVNAERAEEGVLSVEQTRGETKSEMLRSRLPYRRAFKIGSRSMGCKPIRLIVTLILCVITFSALSLIYSGTFFDPVNIATKTLGAGDQYNSISFVGREVLEDTYPYNFYGQYYGASQGDLDKINSVSDVKFKGVISDLDNLISTRTAYGVPCVNEEVFYNDEFLNKYYTRKMRGFLPADTAVFDAMQFGITGRLPENNGEIMITKYIYEHFLLGGFVNVKFDGNSNESQNCVNEDIYPEQFTTIENLLEKQPRMFVGGFYPVIVGVVDTNADSDKRYEQLLKKEIKEGESGVIAQEVEQYFNYGYHSLIYISQNYYDSLVKKFGSPTFYRSSAGRIQLNTYSEHRGGSSQFNAVKSDSDLSKIDSIVWSDGIERTTLADNEFILSVDNAQYLMYRKPSESDITLDMDVKVFYEKVSVRPKRVLSSFNGIVRILACFEDAENITDAELELYKKYCRENDCIFKFTSDTVRNLVIPDMGVLNLDRDDNLLWRMSYAAYINTPWLEKGSTKIEGGYYNSNVTGRQTGSKLDTTLWDIYYEKSMATYLAKALINYKFEPDDYIGLNNVSSHGINNRSKIKDVFDGDVKIVGVYYGANDEINWLFNNKYAQLNDKEEPLIYSFLIAPKPSNQSNLSILMGFTFGGEVGERKLLMKNAVNDLITKRSDTLDFICNDILKIFLPIMFVFSTLLLSSFIAASISKKNREIGILRSMGAKSGDIFTIFLTESIIVAFVIFILSIIIAPIGCAIFNSTLAQTTLKVSLFNFGVKEVAILFAATIGIALVASIIPLVVAMKKKPIDCIRGK